MNTQKRNNTSERKTRRSRLRKMLSGFLAVSTALTMLGGNAAFIADEPGSDYALAGAGSEKEVTVHFGNGENQDINIHVNTGNGVGETRTDAESSTGVTSVDDGELVTISTVDGSDLPEEAEASGEILSGRKEESAVDKVEKKVAEEEQATEAPAALAGGPSTAKSDTTLAGDKETAKAGTSLTGTESTLETAAPTVETTEYKVFDISLDNVETDDYKKGFKVEITLPEEVTGKDFKLYHIHDGKTEDITDSLNLASTVDEETGMEVVSGFDFETKNFSEFVLKYTVDFTYVDEEGNEHFWQFPGTGSHRVSEVLHELGIGAEEISAAGLVRTETVGEYGEKDLYLTQNKDGEWSINSDAAFDDTYLLTVIADEKAYEIMVTDAASYVIDIKYEDNFTFSNRTFIILKQENAKVVSDNPGNPGGYKNQYYIEELTPQKTKIEVNIFQATYWGYQPNPYDSTKPVVIQLATTSESGGTIDYNRLINCNPNNIIFYSTSIDDKPITIDTNLSSATITIGDVTPADNTPYTADISGENVNVEQLSDYYLLAKKGSTYKYFAPMNNLGLVTGKDDTTGSTMMDINGFEIVKYTAANPTLSNLTAVSRKLVDGCTVGSGDNFYTIHFPTKADEDGVYRFTADKQPMANIGVSFMDTTGSNVVESVTLDGAYYLIASLNGDRAFYAPVTNNGKLAFTDASGASVDKLPSGVSYNYELVKTASSVSGFNQLSDATVVNCFATTDEKEYEFAPSATTMPYDGSTGTLWLHAKEEEIQTYATTFAFTDKDDQAVSTGLTLDGNYYILATVGAKQYYAPITGSESASNNLVFTDATSGNTVSSLREGATFELYKAAPASLRAAPMSNSAQVDVSNGQPVTSLLTNNNVEYRLGNVSSNSTTYALTAKEYVPSSKIDKVIVQLTDVSGTPIKPNSLPNENLYILATLTTKGSTGGDVQGWRILNIDKNAFNNSPVGEWSGTLNNAYFYFKPDGNNWAKSNEPGYDDTRYDLSLRMYKSQNSINVDEGSAYNNLKEQGSDVAPDGYAFTGTFTKSGFGGTRKDETIEEGTSVIRLHESTGKIYGMRAYLDAPGLTLTEEDKYFVRVTINHQSGGSSVAFGKLVVNASQGGSTPVELELLSGTDQNGRTSVWHATNASNWVSTVTLNEENVSIAVLKANAETDIETLIKNETEGHYSLLEQNIDSIKSYTWSADNRVTYVGEDGIEHVYDVIRLKLTEGTLSVGEIQNALRDATNFGLYTENLLGHATDMEANIGAGEVTGPVTVDYGFSGNNIFINQIKVTKRWTTADGSGKQGGNVTLKLYPVQGYDERSGAYAGLGDAIKMSGTTDENGLLELTFSKLAPGYYLLTEVQADGSEKSFEDGTNGVVSLGDGKSVTFADGLLKIENINVNVNYFGKIDSDKLDDEAVKTLIQKSRHGWIITSDTSTYERLVRINSTLSEGERSKISLAGSTDYPVTYNIASDMKKLRDLSTRLANETSSQTVKVINTTAQEINRNSGMILDSDGMFMVVNIKVENANDVMPLKVETRVDGVQLKADFGHAGSEYASRVLYNFINPDGTPYLGEIKTNGEGSGILFAPGAKVTHLGANWGGTIVCSKAYHTGSEIHSDSANKTRKINTMLTNAEAEQNVGDLRLEKQTIGDIMPDNTTWFTFTVNLNDTNGKPVNGTYTTSTQRDGSHSVTFENGMATVDVRANNNVIISGIPVGYTYTVDEIFNASNNHYQKAWIENQDGERVNTGTIKKGEAVIARIVNVRKVGGLTVTKTVVGDPSGSKKFEFRVTILNNEGTATDTGFNGAYGNMVFENGVASFTLGNGEFRTAKGIPTGKKFKVEEVRNDQDGFETVSRVVVMNADSENASSFVSSNSNDDSITGEIIQDNRESVAVIASFTNTHTKEATYTPKVTKVLQQVGADTSVPVRWPEEGFTFVLKDSNGNKIGTSTATKDIPIASFDAIQYEKEGTYNYTITELEPDDVAEHKKDGITYNIQPLSLTVTVQIDSETDPNNPTYRIATVKYGDNAEVTTENGILYTTGTITNNYESVVAKPVATKMLNGQQFTGKLGDGTKAAFTFDLKEVNGSTVSEQPLQTVTTDEDNGSITFADLEYIVPGDHVYQITERGEDTGSLSYDHREIYWKVRINNTNGKLGVTDQYYKDKECNQPLEAAVFNNTELTKLTVVKKWKLNGGDAMDDTADNISSIEFYLYRSDGKIVSSGEQTPKQVVDNKDDAVPFTIRKENDKWELPIEGLEKFEGNGNPYTYWITEKPVSGYSSNPEITIIKDGAQVQIGSGSLEKAPAGSTITITNNKYTVSLPATGGEGTRRIYLIGLMLIALAGVGFIMIRRRKEYLR